MLRLSLLAVTLCLVSACSSDDDPATAPDPTASATNRLAEGTWTGGFTPMNHPEMVIPITYAVAYPSDTLALTLGGPGDLEMPARQASVDGDTLRFVFDEPDAGLPLTCALGPDSTATGSFAGRCTDPEGKWAHFTMTPPAS